MRFNVQSRSLKLIAIVCLISIGLFLLYTGNQNAQKVSSYETDGNQITIIDLSKDNKNTNWTLFAGIFMLSMAVVLALNTFSFKKSSNTDLLNSLTVQERKIANHIKGGMSNKEIAQELSISLSTVKTHINNIYKKMNVNSRTEFLNLL